MIEYVDVMPNKVKVAGFLFTAAFIIKFLALAIGFTSIRWLGYILFGIALICLIIAIILCLIQMKNQEKPPSKKDVEKWMKYYNLGNNEEVKFS